jgi:hypothetical protein
MLMILHCVDIRVIDSVEDVNLYASAALYRLELLLLFSLCSFLLGAQQISVSSALAIIR